MADTKHHRVVVTGHGAPDVLSWVEDELPEPGKGEVRVKVLAAGVSGFDLIYRRWAHLPGSPKVPFVLGEDVAGVVDKLGAGVSSLEPGQMVAGWTWLLGVGGGYAEHVCLPETELVPVPPGVDPAEAVCVVVNYLTADQHMNQIGEVRDGERVLIHGAAGGVGTALLQLGKLADLEMYGTASKDQQTLISELGATPIDYQTEDFVERIRALTGDGVDMVVDTVGGAKHLWRSYRTLRPGGRLVWLGSAAVDKQGLRVGPLSMGMAFLLRVIPGGRSVPRCPTVGPYAEAHPGWYRKTLAELLDYLDAGKIQPVIADRIPMAEAARAHSMLERGGHTGKVVLVTDGYESHRPPEAVEP
jgi:NADPH:quinone reductase-like Zn-dependent oxidoreductase